MQFGQQRPTGRLISLTPLIDVVFILLVFFMLASSFLDWRSIDLTVSSGVGEATSDKRAILISLRSDGSIVVGSEPVSKQGL
ncbi:MAG: biopolymer transporter ExbD, partial [Rhodospirillales bacterium]|nr:biopolymer transporter ExbD [Rhodospirillales bacterium]